MLLPRSYVIVHPQSRERIRRHSDNKLAVLDAQRERTTDADEKRMLSRLIDLALDYRRELLGATQPSEIAGTH